MIVYLLSKFITIFFGMLYPAYASYKAIKTKDAKEYVQWMMYWIVFAVYSVVEIFLDTFVGFWFPFYYEVKILFMFWMLSPTTRGGSTLYRNFIHPALSLHEKDIDGYLADVRRKTGNMVTRWGSKALSYVTDSFVKVILRTPNTLQYYIEGTQQRPDGRRMGHYGKTDNQGNMYDGDTDAMDNRYYQDDDNSIMDVSNDTDVWNDGFSEASPVVNVRTKNVKANRIDKDPTSNPRGVVRKDGPMPKKMNNEFGNFSMVTAQDGSMQSKPIIFGWYPNMAPSDLPPDISSGLMPSVFPSIVPTVPFIAPQTNLSESTNDAANKLSAQSENHISVDNVIAATTPVVERLKSEDQDSDSFFDCEDASAKNEKREPEIKKQEPEIKKHEPDIKKQEPEVKKQESEVKKREPDVKKSDPINISANIKVVTKATLQGFDEKDTSVKNAPSQSQRSVDNLTRHTSTESLAAIHRKTASLTSLSKLDKTKARKSFSGTDNKPKPGLFSTQSFRRVLHPFVSSKPLSSSHSSKNIARSSTNVDATEKKSSATKSDKS